MLREYREITERIRLLKIDLDCVGREITELVLTGAPMQRGGLTRIPKLELDFGFLIKV